ncbi:PepSY-associated TM helix domain-containing protein [Flavobacterium sp.]|uniref:PepSY-associated TM helix domain-containing protein n=1 Tax=Flavobacterium sp. TaxID=239 RepID=UPI0026240006|nr:PepSY-associated TM helix domain-containing protein [Flavobacterium sp.]
MAEKKKNTFKKAVFQIHKWLGLVSGLIVFIVAITGCIFCFQDEIKDALYDWRKVEMQDKPFVLPSVLHQKSRELFPGGDEQMVFYGGKDRPALVLQAEGEKYFYTYFNPYTGAYLYREDLSTEFFTVIEEIHMHLLLPEPVGKQVVGISTIIFVILLISGIIQWWPKKRKHLKDRLRVKWSAKWRRINYDWHNVTGFYIALLALVLALTGLSFSYEWMHKAMYVAGNAGKDYPEELQTPVVDTTLTANGKTHVLDIALTSIAKAKPQSEMFFVWKPDEKSAVVAGAYPMGLRFEGQSNMYFHPQTGDLLKEQLYENKSAGLKFQEINYALHTGQYFGLTGKIIAFIVSFLAAALPVTGFIMWFGRNNKKKKAVA